MSRVTAIIVPGRVASTRFPAKLLFEIEGKPLILWTADRIRSEAPEYPLYFAVDGERLAAPLRAAGYSVVLTKPSHVCGTDRIAEANRTIQADFVIDVQADEPLVSGRQIRQLDELIRSGADMATLVAPLRSEADFLDPSQVKCCVGADGHPIYFSRSPIPHLRGSNGCLDARRAVADLALGHLGLYAYTRDSLARFSALPPSTLELAEGLEMLRAVEHGFRIALSRTDQPAVEINTLEQAQRFKSLVHTMKGSADR